MKILKRQLDERRSAAKRKTVDFFDLVIDELNKPNPIMNENVALDLLLLLLFASHETTSIGLTAIIKFLTDNPKALQELTVSKRFITIHHNFFFVCLLLRTIQKLCL
jgi:cytochrome P450 family 26 subfamily A